MKQFLDKETGRQTAIITRSLAGRLMAWNEGAEEMFGYSAEEVIGKHISVIIPFDYQDEEYSIVDRLRHPVHQDHSNRAAAKISTVRRAKGGEMLNVSLVVIPVRNDQGKIAAIEQHYVAAVPRNDAQSATGKQDNGPPQFYFKYAVI